MEKWKDWIKQGKNSRIVFLLGIAGVGLIFFSGILEKKEGTNSPEITVGETVTVSADAYTAALEKRMDAVRLVRENLALCDLADKARVHAGDSMAYLRSSEKFDLIFLDPPYGSDLLNQALETIAAFDICRAHGIIVAESAADKALPVLAPPYRLYREYRYGQIKLTVFHRDGNED